MGYEFFEEKIIFPSAPVPGINNDQSLRVFIVIKYLATTNQLPTEQ